MIVIYHNDADGRLAAAIAGRARRSGERVLYIEADYAKAKNPVWLEKVRQQCTDLSNPDEDVVIVDFSMPVDWMNEVREFLEVSGTRLIWIDHHASCKDYPTHFHGLRDFTNKGPSGCELAWIYFCTLVPVPALVEMVGDYDAWRLKMAPDCKRLILYLDSVQASPESSLWDELMASRGALDLAVERGGAMEKYRDGYCEGLCKAYGFETVFQGLRCYALNIQRTGSMAFGARMDQFDACLAFIFDGTMWTVSMYSTKPEVDCSVICKSHGGGGHKGAAGFQCAELPFSKETKPSA